MKIGITFDLREDYGIERNSLIYADFCHPDEIDYMARGLEENGYESVLIGNMYHLNERILHGALDCDLVLVCDEGWKSRNREIMVPALLELNRIPYVGSDAYCMGLSQNKYHTKLVAQALGICCPKGIYLPFGAVEERCAEAKRRLAGENLSFPLVVKPNEEGYSMGVFLVHDEGELRKAVAFNFAHYREAVLIEEYVRGQELYAPIVGTGERAYLLGVGICRYEDGSDIDIFSLEDKCFRVIRDEIPELSEGARKRIEHDALLLYRHMGCQDFGRCDFKLREDGTPVLIEINPRPGLTEGGPFENCARAAGKSYASVLGEIVTSARNRYGI